MDSFTFIADMQQVFSFADGLLRWLSLHAYSKHYLLLAAVIYWSGFHRLALSLSCGILLSTMFFLLIKPLIAAPRPFMLDTGLFQGVKESGYGMPSGHSQNATVFWGLLAWNVRNPLITAVALLFIVTISLSRVYLGVHFPSQVLVGITIGCLVAILCAYFARQLSTILATIPRKMLFPISISVAVIAPIIILVSGLVIGSDTHAPKHTYLVLLIGVAIGLIINHSSEDTTKTLKICTMQVLVRTILGLVTTILIWQLTATTPTLIKSTISIYSYSFLRGLIITLWCTILWPRLHQRLCLPGNIPA
ncbi:MAG: phosphatase PAP2 family protein [Candidatus Endonucleobacter bathymodioli]|uniref:undecaprenyl-diphosphate phosphatase n=1 Tax=Candidatus Endonucleibacter bathymodioli TaxID=539814 RepID=A0AA90P148_9GAMM|nr:phosphatase PAP2 family protein [Candidatus Endonucleobacter bathymodioli]